MELLQRLNKLTNALVIEKEEELNSYVSGFGEVNVKEKVESGKTLFPLAFQDVEYTAFGDVNFIFGVNENQSANMFRVSSSVGLFNLNKEEAQGTIVRVRDQKLWVKFNQDDVEDWIKDGKLGLDLLPDSKTYDLFLSALNSIKDSDFPESIKRIYSGKNSLIGLDGKVVGDLNKSQSSVVNKIVSQNEKAIIVHGPPGTGKTTTLVSAIAQLVNNGQRVLVVAPTNAAIDNCCLKLMSSDLEFCRIGNPAKVNAGIEDMTLDVKSQKDSSFKLVERLKKDLSVLRKKAFKFKRSFNKEDREERNRLKKEVKFLRADIRKMQKDIYETILNDVNVLCGTFAGVLSEKGLKDDYDYVFVDEAAQSIEPAVWAVSRLADKLVLAGDNFQLPPFVRSSKALDLGLAITVFDSAIRCGFKFDLLNVQYRMNDKIMAFSNSYFYENELTSAKEVGSWVLKNEGYQPIEFIDTAGCDYNEEQVEDSKGLFNSGEVGVVVKRIEDLNFESNSFALISPYRSQVTLLQEKLPHIKSQIDTIDSFQGQERDLIVLSLVRSNQKNEIGFLKDYRRINVAMTRAKKKLIIIGDSSTVGVDKFFEKMLDFVESNGSYRSAWEFM